MISRSRTTVLSACLFLTVAGLALPDTAGATPGRGVRYAGPHGSGSACSRHHPCALTTAIGDAPNGFAVVLKPGSYGSAATPITTEIDDTNGGLAIHGEAGKPLPTIFTSADYGLFLANNSTLSHLAIDHTGGSYGLLSLGPSVDHVIVVSSANGAGACSVFGTLSDSLCIATGPNGTAVSVAEGSTGPVVESQSMRGVTALATDPSGIGLLVDTGTNTTLKMHATNDIVSGGGNDVVARTNAANSASIITLHHCDVASVLETGPGTRTVNEDSTDITAPPVYVNAAGGDFREAANSPTVNAGAKDRAKDTDLRGHPRTLGRAPDMGAYELPQPPVVGQLSKRKLTSHSAKLTVPVNPEGLATTVRFLATHRHAQVTSSGHAGHGVRPRRVHITLTGLAPHKRYSVVVKARNAAGSATSSVLILRTPKHH